MEDSGVRFHFLLAIAKFDQQIDTETKAAIVKRYAWNFALLFFVSACGCMLLFLPQCAQNADRAVVQGPRGPSESPGADESVRSDAGLPDIHAILTAWSAGDRERAVELLLKMYDANAPLARYRPYDMSEERFVSLPPNDRENLGGEMVAAFEDLGDFSRLLVHRAEVAANSEDFVAAEKILLATKRLGVANMGTSVTHLANLVGEAIHRRAEQELLKLARNRG